jgi:hypothetical protein
VDSSSFFQVTLGGLLGSSVATTVLGALFLRWNKTVESEIKSHFDQQFNIFQSTRTWQQQALAELFGPLVMHLDRTKAAFDRWDGKNLFLEGQVVRQGNQTVRDTLLNKGHLIPPHLIEHATKLIVHYDVWMEAFDRVRNSQSPTNDQSFVFAGPAGYPFPRESEIKFKEEFARLQRELYGV